VVYEGKSENAIVNLRPTEILDVKTQLKLTSFAFCYAIFSYTFHFTIIIIIHCILFLISIHLQKVEWSVDAIIFKLLIIYLIK
jgi:hypothetical protein